MTAKISPDCFYVLLRRVHPPSGSTRTSLGTHLSVHYTARPRSDICSSAAAEKDSLTI